MRRLFAAGAMAALFLSIGSLSAADDPAPAAPDTPWYDRVFSSPPPKQVEKKAPPRPPTTKEVALSLKQEQDLYFERLKFSDKLREIALQTNDDKLQQKGEKLDALAFEIYTKRTRNLEQLMKEAKAAETSLDDKRNWNDTLGLPPATASAAPARAPNGRPIVNRSE